MQLQMRFFVGIDAIFWEKKGAMRFRLPFLYMGEKTTKSVHNNVCLQNVINYLKINRAHCHGKVDKCLFCSQIWAQFPCRFTIKKKLKN